ncbi:MAG: DUF434 domain-containing protein [Thermoguttaceae bacterium]|nr:DUF434 domain-containing protein [Thermoguttaceae bacterium]MDW8036673.1 DUF434 domain-containing protein [Thermoguttaceae bacterium]
MPDRRLHRGPHPEDAELFSPAHLDRLREATSDLCWLASRGYAEVSSLKLVGDRYHLTARQRLAVARCACSEAQLQRRLEHEVRLTKADLPPAPHSQKATTEAFAGPAIPAATGLTGSRASEAGILPGGLLDAGGPSDAIPEADTAEGLAIRPGMLAGQTVWIDGYNLLTTVEAALAGGVILHARDGTFRDMASMHGTFRKVAETEPALETIGQALAELAPAECVWYLDRPVSNSGRLKQWIEQTAQKHGWPWRVELVANPDPILWSSPHIVASADSVILDHCQRWLNLARIVIQQFIPGAWVVQL